MSRGFILFLYISDGVVNHDNYLNLGIALFVFLQIAYINYL